MSVISIVKNKYASMLILEDDVDWDVRLKSQMADLATGVRLVTGASHSPSLLESFHSPYGDDWDLIWAGHCGEAIPPDEEPSSRHVVYNDETVAPLKHVDWIKDLNGFPAHSRVYHKSKYPICSLAYAVSLRGAQKILLQLGLFEGEPFKGHPNSAYDNNLGWMCEDNILDMKCVSVTPSIFNSHRSAGPESKDSDINNFDESSVRLQGTTDTIMWSTRINAARLIKGEKDYETRWSVDRLDSME
jgi:hypothetical protein